MKQLRTGSAAETARVLDEVRAIVNLDHPHVVRVLEVVDDVDGVTVVMQYAPGSTLADLLASRRLDAGETVALAAPLADALASAHRRGIVHGDVKPANVLFTSDGEPLLTDFGNGTRGTDGYIAPEVLAGQRVDARSDVFALGVVCREALGDDVPPELAGVLDAAVAVDPGDRPANASELAQLLRAAVPRDEVRLPGPAPGPSRVPGPPTRIFGPRPPGRPAVRARRRSRVALLPLLLVLPLAACWLRPGSIATPRDCPGAPAAPDGAQLVRGDTAGRGCLSVGVYVGQVLTIRLQPDDPAPKRFALGLPGDVLSLGDWNCDGVASPKLFRPSTGANLYYESWSSHEAPVAVTSGCR